MVYSKEQEEEFGGKLDALKNIPGFAFKGLQKYGEGLDWTNDQVNLRNALRISNPANMIGSAVTGQDQFSEENTPDWLDNILDYSYKDARDDISGGAGWATEKLTGSKAAGQGAELLGQVLLPDAVDFATGGVGYLDNLGRLPGAIKKISAKDGARIVEDVFSRSRTKAGEVYRTAEETARGVAETITHPVRSVESLTHGLGGTGNARAMSGSSAEFGGKMSNLYPEHVNLVNTKLREFGMEDGVFHYDTFVGKVRKAADGTPPSIGRTESREFVELFQSVKNMAEDFKGIRDKGRHVEFKSRWVDFLKDRNMKASNIQLHHVDTLYDSLPLYDGLRFDSDEWWDLTATLLNNNVRPGTTFHKGKSNLLSVIGYSNQWGTGLTDATPHGVAHLYYADKLKDFFTPEVMNNIRTVPGYRLDIAQDFSEIVNKSEDIVEQAMKTWDSMNPKGEMGFDEVIEFLSTLDDSGMLDTSKIAGKYQVPQLRKLIESITSQTDKLPTLTPKQRVAALRKVEDAIKRADPNWWSNLSVPDKMAQMKEKTGYTYRQLESMLEAGWITPEYFNKLFQ